MDKVELCHLALNVQWNVHFQSREHFILKMWYFCLTVVWKLLLLANDTGGNHKTGYHLFLPKKKPYLVLSHLKQCMVLDSVQELWKAGTTELAQEGSVRGQAPVSTDDGGLISPAANPFLLKSAMKVDTPLK